MAAPCQSGFRVFLALCAVMVVIAASSAFAQNAVNPVAEPSSVPDLHLDITTISVKGRHWWVSVEEGEAGLWACEVFVKCYRIDTSTAPPNLVPLGLKKTDSLALGFGSLWAGVPRGADAGIHRLNPETNEEVAKIPVSGSVFIADGSVWAAEGQRLLHRVNPESNQVTAKVDLGKDIVALTAAEGSVWILRKTGVLSRIDPQTNQSLAEVQIGQRRMERLDLTNFYAGLAAGEGAVWITEHTTDGRLIRVDSKTNQVAASIPVGYQPSSIAVGGGFVWVSVYFTNRAGHLVVKVDPQTNQILGKIFLAGQQPKLHAQKDGLLAWGEDLRPGWTGHTMIWKIPY